MVTGVYQLDPLTSWSMSRSPTPRRRATLASLAAELKVSRTTISNAYNRPDQLSADLRERVLATAKRLGYPGPDPVARSLRTRKAGAVGLMITEPLNYSFSDPAALDFVAGLAESCEEAGQGLLLVAIGPNRSVGDGSAAVLAAGVDGFVVYSASDDDPYLPVVQQRHLPVVVVDQPKDVPGTSRVCIDDRGSMRRLAARRAPAGGGRSGAGADAAFSRAARADSRCLRRDDRGGAGSRVADCGRELRTPADVGWGRRRSGIGRESADHGIDVYGRCARVVGDGLPTRAGDLRAGPDDRDGVRWHPRGITARRVHRDAAEP